MIAIAVSKTPVATPRPDAVFVASNLTDEELCNLVSSHFPNLKGPLAEVMRRFELRCVESVVDYNVPCTACGTQLDILINNAP